MKLQRHSLKRNVTNSDKRMDLEKVEDFRCFCDSICFNPLVFISGTLITLVGCIPILAFQSKVKKTSEALTKQDFDF